MADKTNGRQGEPGSATDSPPVTDTSNTQPGHTGAGQEASQGKTPQQHPNEHQSGYGGGGANGGSDRA